MDKYRIIRALGIDVIPAPTLTTNAAMVRGESIALIRPDLEDHEHDEAADWILAALASGPPRP